MKKYTYITFFSILLSTIISCKQKDNSLSAEESSTYAKIGQNVIKTTASTMVGQVKGQMKKGGVKEAVPYCNKNASSILKAISKDYHVIIKRTTNKLRNPDNHPDSRESEILNRFLKLKEEHKHIEPVTERGNDGKIHHYAPIFIQKKCLTCHGQKGKELTEQTDSIIRSFYPEDQATGYQEGDLRGIWSITFLK